jgi:hypothetical protein
MCNGHWNWFWANFTGTFMQIAAIQVYRPFQLVCEMIDWSIFKTNAQGWYAFNLAYFVACVSFVYLVVRRLLSEWGQARAGFIGLFAAALFAFNPLRCESISWMVGRVDVVAALFYLASFYLFLQPRKLGTTAGAIACFIAGLLIKEMPVGLPVVLFALTWLGLARQSEAELDGSPSAVRHDLPSLMVRSKRAFSETYPWWITLALYFAVRIKCLGTAVGGYAAGLGGGPFGAVSKWLDPDTLHRLFFPFNISVVPEPNVYSTALTVAFGGVVALTVLRLMTNSMPWRWLTFCAVWLATCAAPIFQLWGIGYQLEGGRFFYFLSIPLAMVLAMLALAPYRNDQERVLSRNATIIGALLLSVIAFAWAKVAMLTNTNWVNAGKEVRRFHEACLDLVKKNPNQKFVILGVPERSAGAHQILNGTTFSTLFVPPFSESRLADRFVNFEPIMFGPEGLVNESRLRSCVSKGFPILCWDREKRELEPVQIKLSDSADLPTSVSIAPTFDGSVSAQTVGHTAMSCTNGLITLKHVMADDGVRITIPSIRTADYDSLEFDAAIKGGAPLRKVQTVWFSSNNDLGGIDNTASETIRTTGKEQHLRIRLSHHWRWFVPETVNALLILPGTAEQVSLKNIRLVRSEIESPTLQSIPNHLTGPGIVTLAAKKLRMVVNPRSVPGAASALIEVGKPSSFYDTIEDAGTSAETSAVINANLGGETTITGAQFKSIFKNPGFYQLRARCLDSQAKPIGYFSDPITVLVQ